MKFCRFYIWSKGRADGETDPSQNAFLCCSWFALAAIFICHKEWRIWKLRDFLTTLSVRASCPSYLFLQASSNFLCTAEWKWRTIGLVSVQPQTTLSKLPFPQVRHLFIDDGYGGLTGIPKTTVGRNDFEGFLAEYSSPFPSTKPSWAFWPGLWTWHSLALDRTWQTGALGARFRFVLNSGGYSREMILICCQSY